MKKIDFVRQISEECGYPQKAIKEIISAMETVAYRNAVDDEVPLFNGLTLTSKIREAYTAKDPRTKEPIEVPTKRVPKVKIGLGYKNAVAL